MNLELEPRHSRCDLALHRQGRVETHAVSWWSSAGLISVAMAGKDREAEAGQRSSDLRPLTQSRLNFIAQHSFH